MTPPRVTIGDLGEIRRVLVADVEAASREAITTRNRFVVALPGGSVARTCFPTLAASAIDWHRADIFWVDERAVPPDHADSNYAIALALLLAPARVPLTRVHRMHGELPDLEQAARRDSDELKSIAGDPPQLDLALVGVGEDGHVASIFHRPAAAGRAGPVPSSNAPVVAVYNSPKPPARRLTLTLPVIAAAHRVVVAAFGRSKSRAIRDALDGDAATPVARLVRASIGVHMLLDRDAAAELLS